MTHDYVSELEHNCMRLVDTLDRDPLLGRVISGSADLEDYVQFLIGTYHYLRWSGPLLVHTARGLSQSGRSPVLLALLEQKAEEEAPHDQWVLADLSACGAASTLVQQSPVPAAVQTYVKWSTLLADAGSPGFLGAAYALEFISMRRAKLAADNLRANRRIPNINDAVSFLDGHADADHEHIAQLNALLHRVSDPADRMDITLSCTLLCELYPKFFVVNQPASEELPCARWA